MSEAYGDYSFRGGLTLEHLYVLATVRRYSGLLQMTSLKRAAEVLSQEIESMVPEKCFAITTECEARGWLAPLTAKRHDRMQRRKREERKRRVFGWQADIPVVGNYDLTNSGARAHDRILGQPIVRVRMSEPEMRGDGLSTMEVDVVCVRAEDILWHTAETGTSFVLGCLDCFGDESKGIGQRRRVVKPIHRVGPWRYDRFLMYKKGYRLSVRLDEVFTAENLSG